MPRAPRPLFVLLSLAAPFLLLAVVTCGPLGRPGLPQPDHAVPPAPTAFEFSVLPAHDLAALTPAAAARLDGKRSRFLVTIAGPPDRQGDRDVYEVLPLNDPQGTLQLEAGPDAKGIIAVDATLQVIHHPRLAVGAADVAAFTEYRLVDAVRAGP